MPSTDDGRPVGDQPGITSDGSLEHRIPGKRILVVNDTQEILELFDDLLSHLGHEVTLMSFAPNELDRVKQARPELIIIDFILGGREMDGWQLLQKLKMDRDTERLPVIVCTAAVHEVREQEGYLTSQGVVVLLKPFSLDQLGVALEKAFLLQTSAMGITRPDSWADDMEAAERDDTQQGIGDENGAAPEAASEQPAGAREKGG
ncbi:MAG: two-component system response regulator [Candidatus Limnocylindria bacterium]